MSNTLSPNNRHKLHGWMYTLLYPAVLGTMLVSLLFSLSVGWFEGQTDFGYKLWFAVFLIFYFSSQHVENQHVEIKRVKNRTVYCDYSGWEFTSDFVELVLMIPLFYLLGVYEPKTVVEIIPKNDWVAFYVLLSISFAMPIGARYLSDKFIFSRYSKTAWLSGLSTIALGLSLTGLGWNTSRIILAALYLVLVVYLLGFVFEGGKTRVYKDPDD